MRVSRSETDVYAAIMDEYLAKIMKILRQEIDQVSFLKLFLALIGGV